MDSNFITFVTARDLSNLSGRTVERALRMIAPDLIESVQYPTGPDEVPHLLRLQGSPFVLLAVARPLPPDAWSEAARRSILFKEAGTVIAQSPAHVVIAALDEATTHRAARRAATGVTLLAAAIAMIVEGEAAVFSEAKSVLRARALIDEAKALNRSATFPLSFWTTLQFFRGPCAPDGLPGTGAVTTGMQPFIGREIEFVPSALEPVAIAERVLNLCNYLLEQGPVVNDGDTIGQSDCERIRARACDQGQQPGIPVLQFGFEAGSPPPTAAPGPIPLVQPITPSVRRAARPLQGERVFGKRRWTGS